MSQQQAKADQIIQSFVNRNYGNIVGATNAIFDVNKRKWVAHLKADYPRIIQDDKEKRRFMKFLSLRDIGEIRLWEDLVHIEATERSTCAKQVGSLLNRWQLQSEQIVVSASAMNLARIGVAKDTLSPIVTIISNFLREHKEVITFEEIGQFQRVERMRMYFHFLEQISLLRKTENGYGYTPLFTDLRSSVKNDEEFKTKVIAHIIQDHYPSILGFFRITRFEPFVHVDNCYYRPAIEVGETIGRKEESLISQYQQWYGNITAMRLRPILDELVRVDALKREGNFYYGNQALLNRMLELRQELPDQLVPMRA